MILIFISRYLKIKNHDSLMYSLQQEFSSWQVRKTGRNPKKERIYKNYEI